MSRASIWSNSDGLAVGFGPRTETTAGSYRLAPGDGATEKLIFRFRGEDLADAVSTTSDAVIHAPVIPNGATILSATLKVTEAFVGATAVLDIGTYDKDGAIVDDDGIDSAIAVAALTLGAEIACDGADVNTVVATTGGVKIAASYDTAAFTAGEAVLEVEYATAS